METAQTPGIPDPNDGLREEETEPTEKPNETYYKFLVLFEGHMHFKEADVKSGEAQRILAENVTVYTNRTYGPHIKVESQTAKVDLAFPAHRARRSIFEDLFGAPSRD